MNNSQLIEKVAADLKTPKTDTKVLVDTVLDAIQGALAAGEDVSLQGFGKFTVKSREAREGRNPQTGASIQIAASKSVGFKAGSVLKAAL